MEQVRRFTSSPLGPYERGRELGEAHGSEVARTVAAYRRLFTATAVGSFDVDAWGERAADRIAELSPEQAQEIRGIAEGAGLRERDVAAVNARTELLAVANPTGVVSECSTVVATPPGRAPVAVQTWDWYDAMSENWLHWTIPHPDGHVTETVTEYGVLGKIGVNDAGLGVMFNMLHHRHDDPAERQDDELGFPLHLLSRRILDTAGSVAEAVALARSVRVSASSSLTVVDDSGAAATIEMFPGGPGVAEPEDGLLVRTNHFISEAGEDGCLAEDIGPGSRIRRTTLRDALTARPPWSAADVVAAMDDHRDVGGVCAHPDRATDPVLWHATLATVRLDVARHALEVTPGGPCCAATADPSLGDRRPVTK